MDLVRFGAWLRLHAPESAGTVDMATIGNEQNFRAVAGPHRADFVVNLAVVIARKRAEVLRCELLNIGEFTIPEAARKDVEVPLIGGRHKCEQRGVGRESWLDIYCASRGELSRASFSEI